MKRDAKRARDGSEEVNSQQVQFTSDIRKRKRARHSKVRTGCYTCRKRHVKCDEAKPLCNRCTSKGYKCSGYAMIDSTELPIAVTASLPSPTPPRSVRGRDEHGAFQFFMDNTITWLASKTGPCVTKCHADEFWNPVVLQITQSEPAFKHILLAWSELHRRILYEQVSPTESFENEFFWQNHCQALRLLGSSKEVDASVMLIACIMFCVLENFRGRRDVFVRHLQSGIQILQHYDATPLANRGTAYDWMIERYVRPIFVAFSLNLPSMVEAGLTMPRGKMGDRFVKIKQASRMIKSWN